jgi:hypothetical protein
VIAGPGDDVVDGQRQVAVDAGEDVFLALVVVVERGAGDLEALGDLAERRLVVAAFGENVEGRLVDALPNPRSARSRLTSPPSTC